MFCTRFIRLFSSIYLIIPSSFCDTTHPKTQLYFLYFWFKKKKDAGGGVNTLTLSSCYQLVTCDWYGVENHELTHCSANIDDHRTLRRWRQGKLGCVCCCFDLGLKRSSFVCPSFSFSSLFKDTFLLSTTVAYTTAWSTGRLSPACVGATKPRAPRGTHHKRRRHRKAAPRRSLHPSCQCQRIR